jgi:hypothetical protein
MLAKVQLLILFFNQYSKNLLLKTQHWNLLEKQIQQQQDLKMLAMLSMQCSPR